MKYRKLGKTNLLVSELAIGCSGFWGNHKFEENKAASVIHEAFEQGINFFDTGHNYCNYYAEPRLGRIVKEIISKNDRTSLIISTKAGTIGGGGLSSIFARRKTVTKDFSPDYIEKSCVKSINNLNCDYLDIFQLHGPRKSQITEPLIERLLKMKKKGMFRYLGVTSHVADDMLYISKYPEIFDMVLTDYNTLQLDREPIIDKLHKAGIGVVSGTVLGQGHLVKGKIGQLKTKADFWYLTRARLKDSSRRLTRVSKEMRELLASLNGITGSQAAFAYVLGNPNISSCVLGTTNIVNLLEIVDGINKNIDEDDKIAIRKTFNAISEKIST